MNLASGSAVLIDVADRRLADRISLALAEESFCTTCKLELPTGIRLDVVVSTRSAAPAELGLAAAGATDVGLLLVGADDPAADACLPADFADRELTLGCRLLAQLVQWRRERSTPPPPAASCSGSPTPTP